jgi:hypothetical protein
VRWRPTLVRWRILSLPAPPSLERHEERATHDPPTAENTPLMRLETGGQDTLPGKAHQVLQDSAKAEAAAGAGSTMSKVGNRRWDSASGCTRMLLPLTVATTQWNVGHSYGEEGDIAANTKLDSSGPLATAHKPSTLSVLTSNGPPTTGKQIDRPIVAQPRISKNAGGRHANGPLPKGGYSQWPRRVVRLCGRESRHSCVAPS